MHLKTIPETWKYIIWVLLINRIYTCEWLSQYAPFVRCSVCFVSSGIVVVVVVVVRWKPHCLRAQCDVERARRTQFNYTCSRCERVHFLDVACSGQWLKLTRHTKHQMHTHFGLHSDTLSDGFVLGRMSEYFCDKYFVIFVCLHLIGHIQTQFTCSIRSLNLHYSFLFVEWTPVSYYYVWNMTV